MRMFEYEFVRVGEGMFGVRQAAVDEYQDAIRQYAAEGWRLVQVFAPPTTGHGRAPFIEIIFERQIEG